MKDCKDILVTAGHCVSNRMANSCENFYWVFDYKIQDSNDPFEIYFPRWPTKQNF